MNTLTTEPVKSLISRLFAEAESSDSKLRQQASATPSEQRQALMRSTTQYREFYGRVKEFYRRFRPTRRDCSTCWPEARGRAPSSNSAPRSAYRPSTWHRHFATTEAAVSSAASSRMPRSRRRARICRQRACLTSLKSGRVTPWRPWPATCPMPSTGAARRRQGTVLEGLFAARGTAAGGGAHRGRQCQTIARNTWPAFARRIQGIRPYRSPTTSRCRCAIDSPACASGAAQAAIPSNSATV